MVDPAAADGTERSVRHGGKPTLTVLVRANADVLDCVLPIAEGGRKLECGLVDTVRERTKGIVTVDLRHSLAGCAEQVLDELRADQTALVDVDVVVMSIEPDATSPSSSDNAAARYGEAMSKVAQLLKDTGTHLIVFNGSSFDANDTTTCYAGVDSTAALVIQQLNRALIELSVLDGLSIIDVDRIMAEIGGRSHVDRPLSYSPSACEVIREELVRVLDDYGFFEDRALLAQVGRRR